MENVKSIIDVSVYFLNSKGKIVKGLLLGNKEFDCIRDFVKFLWTLGIDYDMITVGKLIKDLGKDGYVYLTKEGSKVKVKLVG